MGNLSFRRDGDCFFGFLPLLPFGFVTFITHLFEVGESLSDSSESSESNDSEEEVDSSGTSSSSSVTSFGLMASLSLRREVKCFFVFLPLFFFGFRLSASCLLRLSHC